jgi:hypothetical protein
VRTVACVGHASRNCSRFAVQKQRRFILLPQRRPLIRSERARGTRCAGQYKSAALRSHGFRPVGPGLCSVDCVVSRRRRQSRRLDRTRLHMRRLDPASRHGGFGNRGCVDRRGMFGCHGSRPSGGCSRSRGRCFAHRRRTLRPHRFSCRRRGNVCDGRRPGSRRREARRQQGQWIDVALWIARDARAEVHVRIGQVDNAARTDCPHHRRLSHERAARHSDRPEVDERGRVSKRRLDRHRLPARRNRPREGHHTPYGGEHGAAAGRAKVDTSVLAARVRVRMVEPERPQHGAVDGPRPGLRIRDGERTRANDQDRKSPHYSSLLPILRTP